jgi:pSer/pThr/pTyr-binding forkhead associated (FHA) protein
MPLVLVVGSERFPLEKERIVVGRDPACDVVIDQTGIEPRHVEIVLGDAPSIAKIAGEASVGDVALGQAKRLLRQGDTLQLGGVEASVELEDTSPLLDTRQLALGAVRRAEGAMLHPTIVVVEGLEQGARLELVDDARTYRVGRGKQCELVLSDELVSREHVRVVRRGTEVFISDLDATRGTFLGSSRLAPWRDVRWEPSKMVRIADTVLALRLPLQAILDAVLDKARIPEEKPEPIAVAASSPASGPQNPPEAGATAGIVAAPAVQEKRTVEESRSALRAWVIPVAIAVVLGVCIATFIWILR